MPIYEYQCGACGARLEKIQKMNDPVLVDCSECGKPALEKLISAAGFTLKGSGWYKTDYANKPKPASNIKGEGGSSDSSVSCGGSGCAKPECKPATKPSGSDKA